MSVRAMKAGAVEFLTKPFRDQDLLDAIQASLAQDRARLHELAHLCEGWDGRRLRKLVLAALAQRLEVARDPSKLAWDDFLEAARKRGGVEWAGAPAPTSREMFPDVPKDLMHDHDPGHAHGHAHPTHTHQHDHEK